MKCPKLESLWLISAHGWQTFVGEAYPTCGRARQELNAVEDEVGGITLTRVHDRRKDVVDKLSLLLWSE